MRITKYVGVRNLYDLSKGLYKPEGIYRRSLGLYEVLYAVDDLPKLKASRTKKPQTHYEDKENDI